MFPTQIINAHVITTKENHSYRNTNDDDSNDTTKSSNSDDDDEQKSTNSFQGDNQEEEEDGEEEDGEEEEGALTDNNNKRNNVNSLHILANSANSIRHINTPVVTNEEKKKMYGTLNDSETSSLKGYFRKVLFKKLKFVNDNVTNITSIQMNDCFRIIGCVTDNQKGQKYKYIVALMEHCIMSKRNYIVKCIEKKISGQYYCIIVSILSKLISLHALLVRNVSTRRNV